MKKITNRIHFNTCHSMQKHAERQHNMLLIDMISTCDIQKIIRVDHHYVLVIYQRATFQLRHQHNMKSQTIVSSTSYVQHDTNLISGFWTLEITIKWLIQQQPSLILLCEVGSMDSPTPLGSIPIIWLIILSNSSL